MYSESEVALEPKQECDKVHNLLITLVYKVLTLPTRNTYENYMNFEQMKIIQIVT